MKKETNNVFYIEYGYKDNPKQKCGRITISEFGLKDKPNSSFRFFEVVSLSEDYGCVIVNGKEYTPYYSCAEDYYKFFSSENFGNVETTFREAVQKLINNLTNIVLIGNFYKVIQTTAVVPVESP